MRATFFLFRRWMNAEQSPGFAVQRCPMLLPPLRGWPRSRMDIRTHVTGTQCSMFHPSFVPQAFTSPCFLQLCNVRGEPRWYGQWYPKSCLSSTGHHPTPPRSRLRLHCGQSEASDCTIRLCWLVHLEYRKSDSGPWKLSLYFCDFMHKMCVLNVVCRRPILWQASPWRPDLGH